MLNGLVYSILRCRKKKSLEPFSIYPKDNETMEAVPRIEFVTIGEAQGSYSKLNFQMKEIGQLIRATFVNYYMIVGICGSLFSAIKNSLRLLKCISFIYLRILYNIGSFLRIEWLSNVVFVIIL